jgi:hypothetical protein
LKNKNFTTIENILLNDEEILWKGTSDKLCRVLKAVSGTIIFSLIFMIFIAVFIVNFIPIAAFYDTGTVIGFTVFLAFFLIPFFAPVIKTIKAILDCKNTIYVITDKRVIIKKGPSYLDIITIDNTEIYDVIIDVTSTEKMRNAGSISIITQSSTTINLNSITNPYDAHKILEKEKEKYSPITTTFNINDY